jgi:tRNA pseudouridine13 synthase
MKVNLSFTLPPGAYATLVVRRTLWFAVESRREGQPVGRAWGRPLEETPPPQKPPRRMRQAPRAKPVGFRQQQRRRKALRAANRQAAKK